MTAANASDQTAQLQLPYALNGDAADGAPDLNAIMKRFPRTRYQGSKRRWAAAIVSELRDLAYHTVLDAFGGTGAVSYAFKAFGKSVTYNDVLRFNHLIGTALIENDGVRLNPDRAARIGDSADGVSYDDIIARTFKGIYFTDAENEWLDRAVANTRAIEDRCEQAMSWYALFQAAMAKRPYNLFHRCNLYMRTAKVTRGFGNKTTWDRCFSEHVRRFATEANRAITDGRGSCTATCRDVFEIEPGFDLVYLDPPYVNGKGTGVDYRDFYHFLEGMTFYDKWLDAIDASSKHKRLSGVSSPWTSEKQIGAAFQYLFDRFRQSIIVVSYRSDGIPVLSDLSRWLRDFKREVRVIDHWSHQYVLSTNRQSCESLLIGLD